MSRGGDYWPKHNPIIIRERFHCFSFWVGCRLIFLTRSNPFSQLDLLSRKESDPAPPTLPWPANPTQNGWATNQFMIQPPLFFRAFFFGVPWRAETAAGTSLFQTLVRLDFKSKRWNLKLDKVVETITPSQTEPISFGVISAIWTIH